VQAKEIKPLPPEVASKLLAALAEIEKNPEPQALGRVAQIGFETAI